MSQEKTNQPVAWTSGRKARQPASQAGVSLARPRRLDPLWAAIMMRFIKKLRRGSLRIALPNGRCIEHGDPASGIQAELVIHDLGVVRRYLSHGTIGFAEGYMAREFDTPDLARLLTYFDSNADDLAGFQGHMLARWQRLQEHRRNRNCKDGSERNIYAHYDLGNEFFARWLDPSMTYSAAMFQTDSQNLEAAQAAKYDHLCRQMELREGLHVLEVGAGWGGFAEHAARTYGAKVDGITISPAQHEFASRRIFEAGLNDKVSIHLKDYRDIEGRYDRIASIEMFEAVGEEYWPQYFAKLKQSLTPGGRAGLQVITIADRYFESYRKSSDFIQHYIFPGGMLPSPSALRQRAAAAGLAVQHWRDFGGDYARTLAIWAERFNHVFEDLRPLGFDERFRRLWNFYLAYCEAGFRTGSTDVVQVTFRPA